MGKRRHHNASREGGSFLGNFLALTFGLLVSLVFAEIGARILYPRWDEFDSARFMMLVPVEGFPGVPIGRPGFDGWFSQNNGDFRAHIHVNELGLRNDEPPMAAAGRLWVVGDSFTFGWGVGRDEIFGAAAARQLGWEWYSVASPGTDVCGYRQLIARMPAEVKPRAVVLGLTIENDLAEYDCSASSAHAATAPVADLAASMATRLNEIKVFLTGHSALYNFGAAAAKKSPGLENLLIRLRLIASPHVEHSQFDPDRLEAVLDSTAAEIGRFRDMLPPGTPLVVTIIPARLELRDGAAFDRAEREGMVSRLTAMGIEVADPFAAFAAEGLARIHFAHDGHWAPLGHRIAGELTAEHLARLAPSSTSPTQESRP